MLQDWGATGNKTSIRRKEKEPTEGHLLHRNMGGSLPSQAPGWQGMQDSQLISTSLFTAKASKALPRALLEHLSLDGQVFRLHALQVGDELARHRRSAVHDHGGHFPGADIRVGVLPVFRICLEQAVEELLAVRRDGVADDVLRQPHEVVVGALLHALQQAVYCVVRGHGPQLVVAADPEGRRVAIKDVHVEDSLLQGIQVRLGVHRELVVHTRDFEVLHVQQAQVLRPLAGEMFTCSKHSLCDPGGVDCEGVFPPEVALGVRKHLLARHRYGLEHAHQVAFPVHKILLLLVKFLKLSKPLFVGSVVKLLHVVEDGLDGASGEVVPDRL
mmetsp:Transcript_322/g.1082  ORF Transcript_322/g.1082 Transcript_322/m.1082 type:complete len:329 (-) Transcript_322:326-1312(-)